MSDLEKLFEHAPEGATEIAVFPDGELRYATAVSYTHLTLPTNREV